MADYTIQNVYDQARALLRDTQVSGGEDYTNTVLAPFLGEAYRRLFSALMGASKRVQRITYVNFPFDTTILIPSVYGISDLFEPILLEERAAGANIAIVSTTNTTPISVNAPSHGLGTGTEIIQSGIAGTTAPWGQWFVTVTDANNYTLNGSASDGGSGTGGYATIPNNLQFTQVIPIDGPNQGLDGQVTNSLQVYLWQNQQMLFRGCTETQQLRITYWASGNLPANTATVINIDNSIDFLSYATAYGAAQSSGWKELADTLFQMAYGDPTKSTGLLADFCAFQTRSLQRGPQRRQLPFRGKRSRYGSVLLGG
jgi:hypothetical protein